MDGSLLPWHFHHASCGVNLKLVTDGKGGDCDLLLFLREADQTAELNTFDKTPKQEYQMIYFSFIKLQTPLFQQQAGSIHNLQSVICCSCSNMLS